MKLNKLVITFSSVLLVGTLAACENKNAKSQTFTHESSIVVKKFIRRVQLKQKLFLMLMQML